MGTDLQNICRMLQSVIYCGKWLEKNNNNNSDVSPVETWKTWNSFLQLESKRYFKHDI